MAQRAKNKSAYRCMDRKEAARFLGVSLRTLDRIAATGRLTKGRALRKFKQIVVYRREELENLKAELQNHSHVNTAVLAFKPLPKDTVAFRIDPYYLQVLADRAGRAGRSPGEHARHLVIQSLERENSAEILEEVQMLRESLGATFYAFLTLKLGVSADDARRFVAQTILKR